MTESLEPTYVGFIASLADAAIVIEGSMQGYLPKVASRPPQRWQVDIARSGHMFVFEEKQSGIKRWTDGVQWSPSRKQDRFLLYRELDEHAGQNPKQVLPMNKRGREAVADHGLYGALVDSYQFRSDDLMKKTIGIRLDDSYWRLVSYYQIEDVVSGRLTCPSPDQRLRCVQANENIRRSIGCWDLSAETGMALHHQHDASLWGQGLASISDYCVRMNTSQDLAQYEECFEAQTSAYQM